MTTFKHWYHRLDHTLSSRHLISSWTDADGNCQERYVVTPYLPGILIMVFMLTLLLGAVFLAPVALDGVNGAAANPNAIYCVPVTSSTGQ